ncbi:hypothetical protein SRHO_G00050610 [Serrasalmus rhombeus]
MDVSVGKSDESCLTGEPMGAQAVSAFIQWEVRGRLKAELSPAGCAGKPSHKGGWLLAVSGGECVKGRFIRRSPLRCLNFGIDSFDAAQC